MADEEYTPVKTPTGPYAAYGTYIHPDGTVVTGLKADAEDQRLYKGKGFTFVGFSRAPGQTQDAIDWRPWPVTTDGHVIPWNAGPVVPNLPTSRETVRAMGADPEGMNAQVNMPLLAQGGGAARGVNVAAADGSGPRGASGDEDEALKRARKALEERKVPKDQHDAILASLTTGKRRPFGEVVEQIRRSSALPGELVAKGVTRGVRGIDVTQAPLVPGISISDQAGMMAAEARGEVKREMLPVGEGMSVEHYVPGPNAPQSVSGPTDAPGVPAAPEHSGLGTKPSPAEDVTVRDQARHQAVREGAMTAEAEAEGRKTGEKPPARRSSK